LRRERKGPTLGAPNLLISAKKKKRKRKRKKTKKKGGLQVFLSHTSRGERTPGGEEGGDESLPRRQGKEKRKKNCGGEGRTLLYSRKGKACQERGKRGGGIGRH